MSRKEFKELLKAKGYAFALRKQTIVVVHHGYVDLRSLTTLSEGVKFENHGSVDLRSLTTLPEGVKFENHGSVYLDSLTTLPEGVKFENHGSVYLRSPTTLPEGVKFENHGSVYLGSLNGRHSYLGEQRDFRHVDGSTMLFGSAKSYGGFTVHSARFFAGGDIANMKKCYIAESDGTYAHGESIKAAVDDLQYKLDDQSDKAEVAKNIASTGKVTLSQFRSLTGACREGIRQHLAQQNISLDAIDEMTLPEALKAMSGTSYGETFKAHLESVSSGAAA